MYFIDRFIIKFMCFFVYLLACPRCKGLNFTLYGAIGAIRTLYKILYDKIATTWRTFFTTSLRDLAKRHLIKIQNSPQSRLFISMAARCVSTVYLCVNVAYKRMLAWCFISHFSCLSQIYK